jgi:hypothetical protein
MNPVRNENSMNLKEFKMVNCNKGQYIMSNIVNGSVTASYF